MGKEKGQQSTNTHESHHLEGTEGISKGKEMIQSGLDPEMSSGPTFPRGELSLDAGRGTQPSAPSGRHSTCTEPCSQQQCRLGTRNNWLVRKNNRTALAKHVDVCRAHNPGFREQMKNRKSFQI